MGQRSARKISCGQDSSLALDVKVVGVRFEGSKGTFSAPLLRGEKSQKGLEKIYIYRHIMALHLLFIPEFFLSVAGLGLLGRAQIEAKVSIHLGGGICVYALNILYNSCYHER